MGVEPAPGRGFLITQGVLVNPSGNLSARALKSSNFLTSVSTNEVHRFGFRVRVWEAQNSKDGLGWVGEMDGNLVSSNWQF